jgi:hypothetical protein
MQVFGRQRGLEPLGMRPGDDVAGVRDRAAGVERGALLRDLRLNYRRFAFSIAAFAAVSDRPRRSLSITSLAATFRASGLIASSFLRAALIAGLSCILDLLLAESQRSHGVFQRHRGFAQLLDGFRHHAAVIVVRHFGQVNGG